MTANFGVQGKELQAKVEATKQAKMNQLDATASGSLSERKRNVLREYTDAELMAEVVRRRNERERKKPTKWCDECDHFSGALGNGQVIANPCSKEHKMLFLLPEGAADAEWGYYKRRCDDRSEKAQSCNLGI